MDFTGTDSVTSIEAADGVVYVGGHFRWLNNANGNDTKGPGGIDRYGFGALDAANGVPLTWNPGRSPGGNLPAGGTSWGPIVWEIWKGGNGVYVGQDSDGVGNEYHGRQALFPSAGGRTIAVQDAPSRGVRLPVPRQRHGELPKTPIGPGGLGTIGSSTQTNLVGAKGGFAVANKVYWAKNVTTAPTGSVLNISTFTGGEAGRAVGEQRLQLVVQRERQMTGAFYLNGRMYYSIAASNALYYRYLTTDGSVIGCTAVHAAHDGHRLAYGAWHDLGQRQAGVRFERRPAALGVAFDPGAAVAVNGAAATVLAPATTPPTWHSTTLFFATSCKSSPSGCAPVPRRLRHRRREPGSTTRREITTHGCD